MPEEILRADAARNRSQLLEVARALFAERGLDVPLDEIARRAGVGNATLYRRFPTRCHLVAAVFTDALREIVSAAERALAEQEDAWDAFAGHLIFLCETQAANRGIADLLTSAVSGSPELERLRGLAFDSLAVLIDRAKASGDLRADFRHEDVVLILMANAGLIDRTAPAPEASRRHLGYVLDGLRAPARSPAAPPPGQGQLLEAMRALGKRYGCSA
jgi:AcrR family transcriptional regulator